MNCYKCKTTEDLSLKRRLKTGHELFICRPCRRAAAKDYQPKLDYTDLDEWRTKARIHNERLMKKYA